MGTPSISTLLVSSGPPRTDIAEFLPFAQSVPPARRVDRATRLANRRGTQVGAVDDTDRRSRLRFRNSSPVAVTTMFCATGEGERMRLVSQPRPGSAKLPESLERMSLNFHSRNSGRHV